MIATATETGGSIVRDGPPLADPPSAGRARPSATFEIETEIA